MSSCRSCGAPIEWARTPKGKRIPLDVEPRPDGNLAFVAGELVNAAGLPPEVERRVSHFATCPNAAQHRRRP